MSSSPFWLKVRIPLYSSLRPRPKESPLDLGRNRAVGIIQPLGCAIFGDPLAFYVEASGERSPRRLASPSLGTCGAAPCPHILFTRHGSLLAAVPPNSLSLSPTKSYQIRIVLFNRDLEGIKGETEILIIKVSRRRFSWCHSSYTKLALDQTNPEKKLPIKLDSVGSLSPHSS